MNTKGGGDNKLIVQARLADYLRNDRRELKEFVVAEKAGISQSRFSKILNGRSEMRADELIAICKALEVSPDMFVKPKLKE